MAPAVRGEVPVVRPVVDPADRVALAAPAVPAVVDPADPGVRPAVDARTSEVAVVDPADRVAPVVPAVPVDPAVRPVVLAADAVALVEPVGVATLPVRSASPVVVPRAVASPSARSVKSSTTWRPRPSVAFGSLVVPARPFGCHAAPR